MHPTHCMRMVFLLLSGSIGAVFCHTAQADEDLIEWFESDQTFDPATVNEGQLEFLAVPPDKPVHTHYNRITVSTRSLQDGWATLYQCHTHLDPVPSAQIVYNEGRVRNIRVEQAGEIERARVEGVSVQLDNVMPGARLCISAESRVIVPQPDGGFLIRNGPFMRRFLDGYYPMNVRLDIILPPGRWSHVGSRPEQQPGFAITVKPEGLQVDAWFAGELRTGFLFLPVEQRQATE